MLMHVSIIQIHLQFCSCFIFALQNHVCTAQLMIHHFTVKNLQQRWEKSMKGFVLQLQIFPKGPVIDRYTYNAKWWSIPANGEIAPHLFGRICRFLSLNQLRNKNICISKLWNSIRILILLYCLLIPMQMRQ